MGGQVLVGVAFPERIDAVYRPWLVNYLNALKSSGAVPLGLPINFDRELIADQLARVDGVFLTGGADINPSFYGEAPNGAGASSAERDEFESILVPEVLRRDLPVFGVCRGIQALNVFSGGSLIQHLEDHPGGDACEHEISILGGRLARIIGADSLVVNSFHHQAIRLPAPGFAITACTHSGMIEAIEHPEAHFVLGVQWHPERTYNQDENSRKLFDAFVAACRGR